MVNDGGDIIAAMLLTLEEVHHIAKLARLELNDSEIQQFREQLSMILSYASHLSDIDTSTISPTSSVLPLHSILREDEPHPSLTKEELFRNAPDLEGMQFRVPLVFDS